MVHQKSGGRYDGQAWPDRGGEFDVPDEEGAELVARGEAEAVEPPAARKPRTKQE